FRSLAYIHHENRSRAIVEIAQGSGASRSEHEPMLVGKVELLPIHRQVGFAVGRSDKAQPVIGRLVLDVDTHRIPVTDRKGTEILEAVNLESAVERTAFDQGSEPVRGDQRVCEILYLVQLGRVDRKINDS